MIAACGVLGYGLVADALNATDADAADGSMVASLRSTSVVLAVLASGPPIRERTLPTKRWIALVLLICAGFAGAHDATRDARVADASFTFVALAMAMSTFYTFAPSATSAHATPLIARDVGCALFGALLVVSGTRVARIGVVHAFPTARHLENTAGSALPYAHSEMETTLSLVFGGAVGLGAGAAILTSVHVLERGASAAAETLMVVAVAQFAAAFCATLASSAQIQSLHALYASAPCGVPQMCADAVAARRQAVVSTLPAGLWTNSLAAFVASGLQVDEGGTSRKQWQTSARVAAFSVFACAYSLWRMIARTNVQDVSSVTEAEAACTVVAILVGAYLDTRIGPALYVCALGSSLVYIMTDAEFSAAQVQPTHCMLISELILLAVYILWSFLSVCCSEDVIDALSVAGTSIAAVLFLLSVGLSASMNGAVPSGGVYTGLGYGNVRYARWALSFAIQHFFPILVWLPLYARGMPRRRHAVLWICGGLLPLLLWVIVAAFAKTGDLADATASELSDPASLRLASFSAGVVWLSLAFL